jgi:predicted dehydrogenase
VQPQPREGALLVEAQQKYGKLVQMGTQQRSSPHTIEIVDKIHNGLIGRAYYAKAWYSNTRKSIGYGKERPSPPARLGSLAGPRAAQAIQGQRAAL